MDRDKLKEKIAKAICQKGGRRVTDERWAEWLETWRRATDDARRNLYTNDCLLNAEAALTAIEDAGFIIMPKDPTSEMIARVHWLGETSVREVYAAMMAGAKIKEPSNG